MSSKSNFKPKHRNKKGPTEKDKIESVIERLRTVRSFQIMKQTEIAKLINATN